MKETFGMSKKGPEPKKTRDDLTYGKAQPSNRSGAAKGKGGYHIAGRPGSRPGNETDQRALK